MKYFQQIISLSFSTQLPSNPLHHKLTIVPKRDLVAGSFMFPVVCAGGARRAMCALSLLTHQSKFVVLIEQVRITSHRGREEERKGIMLG